MRERKKLGKDEEVKVTDLGMAFLIVLTVLTIAMLASIISPVAAQGLVVVRPGMILPGIEGVFAIAGLSAECLLIISGTTAVFLIFTVVPKRQSVRKSIINPWRKRITTAKGGPTLVLTIAFIACALLCTTPSSVAATTTTTVTTTSTLYVLGALVGIGAIMMTLKHQYQHIKSMLRYVRTIVVDIMKTKGAKTGKPALVLVAIIGITAFLTPTCAALGLPVLIAISPTILLGSCVTVMAVALVLREKQRRSAKRLSTPGSARSFVSAIAFCCVLTNLCILPKHDDKITGVNDLSCYTIIASGFPPKTVCAGLIA